VADFNAACEAAQTAPCIPADNSSTRVVQPCLRVQPQPAQCNAGTEKDDAMQFTLALAPLVSLIAGILILIVPRLLSYIVALYLIIIGLIGLFGGGRF